MSGIIIEDLVEEVTTKPSNKFGTLVLEIDHKLLGQKVRGYRLKNKVKAVLVAKELGLSKVQLHFMEIGRRQWDIKSLKKYIQSVDDLAVNTNGK